MSKDKTLNISITFSKELYEELEKGDKSVAQWVCEEFRDTAAEEIKKKFGIEV